MRRERYLQAMGVPVIVPREQVANVAADMLAEANTRAATPVAPAAGPGVVQGSMAEMAVAVAACERCALSKTRNRTVFGVGAGNASVMVIGEAPGADEDRIGEPFVGRAGQLLDAMLRAVNMPRESIYIANILKCRPPRNRDPASEEVAQCIGYLHAQIEAVNPAVMVAVGRIAAQNLLGSTEPIGRMRGRVFEYRGRPMIVTYHPAYLLRSPQQKAAAWTDLKLLLRTLDSTPGSAREAGRVTS